MKKYTYQDVLKHNHIDSCWIIITNKVYDVTKFIKTHPGGQSILGLAGKDATVFFHMSHPTYVWNMPKKYEIGEIDEPLFKELNNGFYKEVKEAVELQLQLHLQLHNNCNHDLELLSKITITTALYFIFLSTGNLFIGILLGCVSFCFMAATNIHEVGHGVFKHKYLHKKLVEFISECFLGVSAASWRDQHFIHHNDTMNELDPDTNHYPIFRRNIKDNILWYFQFQQYYMYFLYCFLHIEGRIIDIKNMIWQRNITKNEKYWYCLSFIIFMYMFVCAPILMWGIYHGISMFMVYSVTASICAAYIFNLNHLVDGVRFISRKEYSDMDIGEIQVVTSHNFNINEKIMCYLTGGLNFQIEHHLFPSIHSSFYPEISKIVQSKCTKYGIRYNVSKNSFIAHFKHWKLMQCLGFKNNMY